jgi:hypothetical protein
MLDAREESARPVGDEEAKRKRKETLGENVYHLKSVGK